MRTDAPDALPARRAPLSQRPTQAEIAKAVLFLLDKKGELSLRVIGNTVATQLRGMMTLDYMHAMKRLLRDGLIHADQREDGQAYVSRKRAT